MGPRPGARNARLPRPHCTRKLYEFPAVAKVDGLPPAPSFTSRCGGSGAAKMGFWQAPPPSGF
eukprot:5380111-Pyramimonas_sp.AAC.1